MVLMGHRRRLAVVRPTTVTVLTPPSPTSITDSNQNILQLLQKSAKITFWPQFVVAVAVFTDHFFPNRLHSFEPCSITVDDSSQPHLSVCRDAEVDEFCIRAAVTVQQKQRKQKYNFVEQFCYY